jgi:drug/metabolite transporter (DMT)-like permease
MDGMRSPFRVIEGGLKEEDLSSIASATEEVRLSRLSRTKEGGRPLHNEVQGWIFTSLGVICFSLSFVSARLALGGFDPLFIAFARGAIAGPIAVLCALAGKYPLPAPRQALRLCLAAAGIVFVFPIFTTIALQSVPASHAATVSAILPLLTAVFGVWRKRERVPLAFWAIAAGATAVVAWFLISRAGGLQLRQPDLLIIVACVACSYGYAEGGLLSQEIGGWRAICWMLVLSTPLAIVLLSAYLLRVGYFTPVHSPSAWFGLAYQVLVSQFLGFALYYRGLAQGGVAKMSQIQQFQSVLAVLAASLILAERIDAQLWVVVGLLLAAVVGARWAMQTRQRSP